MCLSNLSKKSFDISLISKTNVIEKKVFNENLCTTKILKSCNEIKMSSCNNGDGTYLIDTDEGNISNSFPVYCDMSTSDGGWTQTLRADGTKVTFHYSSSLWENNLTLNSDNTFEQYIEHKNLAFSTLNFSQILIRFNTNGFESSIVLNRTNSSLEDVFNGPTTQIILGSTRNDWKSLIYNSSLQLNCNQIAFNNNNNMRIGIFGNQETNCFSPDSGIGIGGRYDVPVCGGTTNTSVVGNYASCLSDNGDKKTYSFGEIFVR